MRTIERTEQFKKDYKREAKGQHRNRLRDDVTAVLEDLQNDRPLTIAQKDHPLSGQWAGYRDCHLKPDLVLIDRLSDDGTLTLVRLGSHSELGIS